MLPPRPLDGNRQGFTLWPFMSVQSWGENPAGLWRVEIEDKSVNRQIPNAYNSHLSAWSLVMHGTATDPLARQPKILLSSDRAGSSISSAEAAQINAALNCHLSCATCHGPRFDDCGSCFSGYFFHNSQCLLACPHGFLPLNDTMTCSICSSKCTQCLDSSHCLSCQPGHRLENDQCVALHGTVNDECSHGMSHTRSLTVLCFFSYSFVISLCFFEIWFFNQSINQSMHGFQFVSVSFCFSQSINRCMVSTLF